MNRSYSKNDAFVSNKGIYDAYYGSDTVTGSKLQNTLEKLILKLLSWFRMLTGATARRIAKVSGVVLSLVGILGVAGAMETGKLPLAFGLLLCAVLVATEYACLRPSTRKKN